MTTLARLEGKLERLKAQSKYYEPRSLVLVLETGQDIPSHIVPTLRPGDQVIIEEIPPGYFGYHLEGYREPCQQV